MTRILKSLPIALCILFLDSPAALSQDSSVVNYEATYRLTLGDIDYNGAIITAKGAMAMRVRRNCTRWQSHSELLFLLELDNGDKIKTHTMFRERESLDGQNIDFVFWQDISGSGRLEYRGTATIPSDGEAGSVKYQRPKRVERKLPKGVEMPITAMREIVESLATEGAAAKHNYFDPRAKFVEIRSIGGEPIILANPPKGDADLVDGRSWRLRATPIPEGQEEDNNKDKELKEEEEENFTMMQIHDTGVASFMVMKSGITTINAELIEVKRLPFPDCSRPKPPEMQLSSDDCIDGMATRKEDEVAGAEKPEIEDGEPITAASAQPEAVPGADAEEPKPGDETAASTDCDTIVKKEGPGLMDDVESAPVENVEEAPVDELPADNPNLPTEEATEPGEPGFEEATQPEITSASVTN